MRKLSNKKILRFTLHIIIEKILHFIRNDITQQRGATDSILTRRRVLNAHSGYFRKGLSLTWIKQTSVTEVCLIHFNKSFNVLEFKKFIITSSSSLNRGRVWQVPAFSQPFSIHCTGASEPSPESKISATVYCSAGRESLYPPLLPRALVTSPAADSCEADDSKYFRDSRCLSATSAKET